MNRVRGRDVFAEAFGLDGLSPAQHSELGHLLVKCKAQIEDDLPSSSVQRALPAKSRSALRLAMAVVSIGMHLGCGHIKTMAARCFLGDDPSYSLQQSHESI